MASFEQAYAITAKFEGGYANNPHDKGGETYAGISRRHWPNWKGWTIIDDIKKAYGSTSVIINLHASSNPAMQALKEQFYKINFWYPLNLQYFNDQQLANVVYDFGVNSGTVNSAKQLQQAANSLNAGLKTDGQLGSISVTAINKLDAQKLYNAFKNERLDYYADIVKRDPSQAEFKQDWDKRAKVPYKLV